MSLIDKNRILNLIGEFSDRNAEMEFFQQDMQKAMRYIKPMILGLGVLNTLFLIPDYFLIPSMDSFKWVAIARVLFAVLIVVLFIRVNTIKNNKMLAYWITVNEAAAVMVFLFVFYHYKSPNYLIQAFGVMVILLAIFMVPNRWINTIGVALFISTNFLIMSIHFVKSISMMEFSAGMVYIFIIILLCSIFSFRNHCYKRIHYANSKELIKLSTTDPLSGANNRVKLEYELKRWVLYSKRYETPLSLIFFDFDDFKRINDTYGHLTGDQVIIESASFIKNCIRETDIFARWGGEEFIILLPNTDVMHASDLAERLRKCIENHKYVKVGCVTCSFGVVQLSDDDDIESLLHKADQMLYEAKSAGKNVVKSQMKG